MTLKTQRSSIRSDCVEVQSQRSSIRSDCAIVEAQYVSGQSAGDEIHRQYLSVSSGNQGEVARLEQRQLSLQGFPGGRNSRPLVGGYAAAAYEAMKDYYYAPPNNESRTIGI